MVTKMLPGMLITYVILVKLANHLLVIHNRIVHKGDFKFEGTHVFGDKLDSGLSIVKVTQNEQEKTVRLVRY
jgi:hypothetical protein